MRAFFPLGVAVDGTGNVFVSDWQGNTIRKITPGGIVTTLAGGFIYPSGVAVDSAGYVYVADQNSHVIRKITPGGVVSTLAGLAYSPGSADGTSSDARFYSPMSVAVDSAGYVYVAEQNSLAKLNSNTIRKITPGGVVSTLAGLGTRGGHSDGTGPGALVNHPFGVAVDSFGCVYVADTFNHNIRRGLPTGAHHLESESLGIQNFSGATHSPISDSRLSGGAGTQLTATQAGQYVTYTVPVLAGGSYNVKVGVRGSTNGGIFALSINGTSQGTTQDEYTSQTGFFAGDLGVVTFSDSGNKAFTFSVAGKNPNSSGYNLAFDYIELVPTIRLETESLTVQSVTPVPSGYTSTQWFGVFSASAASGGAGTYFDAIDPG